MVGEGLGVASFEGGGLSVEANWYACEAADGQLEVALVSCCENLSPHSTKAWGWEGRGRAARKLLALSLARSSDGGKVKPSTAFTRGLGWLGAGGPEASSSITGEATMRPSEATRVSWGRWVAELVRRANSPRREELLTRDELLSVRGGCGQLSTPSPSRSIIDEVLN